MPVNIAIVDDHPIFADSFAALVQTMAEFSLCLKAIGGLELKKLLEQENKPIDVFLVDVHMKDLDGPEVAAWLRLRYPQAKIVALTLDDRAATILKMLKAGCNSYLLKKDINGTNIFIALHELHTKGLYTGGAEYSDTGESLLDRMEREKSRFTEQEIEFLKYSATRMTYEQIADKLQIKAKRCEKMRDHLFKQFEVVTRTELVMKALRMGLIEL